MSIVDWFAKKKANNSIEREKLDIPGDLWIKCFKCGEVLFNKSLDENSKVCPSCNHHFRLSCAERLEITIDEGTFKEINRNLTPIDFLKFTDSKKYEDRIELARKRSGINDALISGTARINGIEAVLCIMDFSFMGGSMGSVVGEKIARAAEEAIKRKLPLIIMSSSGGARMQEGILSLMQMAKTSAAIKKLSEKKLMYISVLLDPTTGGTTASFAMLGDVNISEPGALIGFAGPRVIEQTIRQKLPKGFQRAEYLLEHGMVDIVVHRKEMKETLAKLLSYAG
ncbi:MAG: acetyl-CoA carboxylase carboxyl transferase subunit beta [Candidatus Margulisiibacteriota bacterium]|nr:MAG: acetyl-CoA carboxylase subunit beta [Candidatus Margulisbacteria bacterium GWD2_39_127]OGI02492.1 MAG: acetyl-CoA carboxylase subunit beta [Candidatus Margulisbacteria bacterium GWF2_38_17]OGI10985.1 MAG: acetyl-CoA carboxylase subunit beta [Candidatus Margulisbacteria bacterium GWE2_39_32]PZM83179.1 MAG: acetyl-CoA carboxylase carboxyl transferase subunit beta [Candidatus Margulisiibacteriota bacterium]HAR62518.1 acetyl-CoA carboxylase carboxyl transferase subunit beta [Candidatus Marg